MPKPRALQPGDLITIVSPASAIQEDQLERATGILEEAGYRVRLGQNALKRDGFLAGQDDERAQDLIDAFQDQETKAVFCARGGYGSARLFPRLDIASLAASGKMFLGFSDITTLHLALNQEGLPTVHAPMSLTLHYDREPWVVESLMRVLRGDLIAPAEAPKGETVVPGSAEGITTGGCLCLLTDSIGTPYPLNANGKIVLIEDVDENPHRVDAMLTHLLNANIIQRAAGIVIGEMTRTDEKPDDSIGARPWREIVQERLGNLGIPMIVNYPFGHMKNMLSLPLGIRARLDAESGTLTYVESLCA